MRVGTIIFNRLPLVNLRTTLKAQWYVDDTLCLFVITFLARHSAKILHQDNIRFHTFRVIPIYLRAVVTLLWSVRLTDISPFAPVWDILGKQIRALRNVTDLEQQLRNDQRIYRKTWLGVLNHKLYRCMQAHILGLHIGRVHQLLIHTFSVQLLAIVRSNGRDFLSTSLYSRRLF